MNTVNKNVSYITQMPHDYEMSRNIYKNAIMSTFQNT